MMQKMISIQPRIFPLCMQKAAVVAHLPQVCRRHLREDWEDIHLLLLLVGMIIVKGLSSVWVGDLSQPRNITPFQNGRNGSISAGLYACVLALIVVRYILSRNPLRVSLCTGFHGSFSFISSLSSSWRKLPSSILSRTLIYIWTCLCEAVLMLTSVFISNMCRMQMLVLNHQDAPYSR